MHLPNTFKAMPSIERYEILKNDLEDLFRADILATTQLALSTDLAVNYCKDDERLELDLTVHDSDDALSDEAANILYAAYGLADDHYPWALPGKILTHFFSFSPDLIDAYSYGTDKRLVFGFVTKSSPKDNPSSIMSLHFRTDAHIVRQSILKRPLMQLIHRDLVNTAGFDVSFTLLSDKTLPQPTLSLHLQSYADEPLYTAYKVSPNDNDALLAAILSHIFQAPYALANTYLDVEYDELRYVFEVNLNTQFHS